MRQYIDVVQDVQGNALVGVSILVQNYVGAGNASIYSDNGLTPISNSTVTSGSDGSFSFFAADGDYNLVFSKNSTVYKTQSPVSIFDGAAQLTFSDTGTANTYAISNSQLEKALRPGLRASVLVANSNTGASTLQYNGLTAKSIILPGGSAAGLPSGAMLANGIYTFEYDGTYWELKTSSAAAPTYAQTAAEAAASVTPVNYNYPPGNVLRYGSNTTPGTTDMTTAITSAIAQAQKGGGNVVYFPCTGNTGGNDYLVSTEIQITGEVMFVGETERLSGKGPRIVSNLNGNTFAVRSSAAIAVTFDGLGFYSSAAANTNQGAFFYIAPSLSGPNSFYFRHCWFYLPNYWALNFAGQCDDVQIEFCTFDVSNTKFIAIGASGQTVTDFRCIGNTFYGGEASFLGCVDVINAQNVIFQGNCFYPISATYPMPYAINAGSSISAAVKNLVVNGNTFGSPSVGGVNQAIEISSGVTQCSITGNSVYNAGSLGIGGGGGVTINQAVITGNTINGYSGSSLGLIDFTSTTLTNSVIANNALVGNIGGTSLYGVNLSGGSNTGNVIGPNAINGVTTPYNVTSWAGNFGVAGPITFTATLTGYASNPTCTARYSVNGNTVTLDLPNTNGTSNATTMTITGLPAAIQPANQQTFMVQVEDNTVFELGTLTVQASGTIAMATGATGAGAFTSSGTKGIGTISVTYQLT